jgi:hypothetical protein
MKLRIISFVFLTTVFSNAQVPESSNLICTYTSLTMANFRQGTVRDDAAVSLNYTARLLAEKGMTFDEICKSPEYAKARRVYDWVAAQYSKEAAAVRVKYSSKE